jgi:hypothetical protein
MHRTRVIAALFVPFLALGACGGDDDSGPEFTEKNLSSELVKAGLLEKDAAECVAKSVFDELTPSQIDDLKDANVESASDLPPELQTALTNGIQSCV